MVQLVKSVTTTVSTILPLNPTRNYLLLVNLSANVITFRFGADATTTIGVSLFGKGAFWESPPGFFDRVRRTSGLGADELVKITAIADAGTNNLQIFER